MFHKLFYLLAFIGLSAPALSLDSDANQEITIQSDRAEFDRKNGTATYIGHVQMVQGTLKIDAERVTLYTNEEQKLTRAVAIGKPARFQQQMEANKGLTKARGNTITYETIAKTVAVQQQAHLEQEGNLFSGDKIVYDITNDSVAATGGTKTQANPEQKPPRVKMIIQPANKQPSSENTPKTTDEKEASHEDA